LRQAGSTVVVMAHRPSAIKSVNKILMLKSGTQNDFGDKKDVLARVTEAMDRNPQKNNPKLAGQP